MQSIIKKIVNQKLLTTKRRHIEDGALLCIWICCSGTLSLVGFDEEKRAKGLTRINPIPAATLSYDANEELRQK